MEMCCLHLITALLCVGFTFSQYTECPVGCSCFERDSGGVVRCIFIGITEVPRLPQDTAILDLRFNRIEALKPGPFQGLTKLTTLLLNSNMISEIEDGTFTGLSSLKYLYLYKNQIKKLGSNPFSGLINLEQLYIHSNDIGSVENSTFSGLRSLQRLFLHNNDLKTLSKESLSNLPQLTRLRLDSNPLVCNCSLWWLKNFTLESQQLMEIAATCSEPDKLSGITITEVDTSDFNCPAHSSISNKIPSQLDNTIPRNIPSPDGVRSPPVSGSVTLPVLTNYPRDQQVHIGDQVLLRCGANGNPSPNIVWYHNNNDITNYIQTNTRLHQLSDGSLTIDQTTEQDLGSYECMAQNAAGQEKSPSASLILEQTSSQRPSFVLRPSDQTISLGGSISLTCTASGAADLRWYKDNRPYSVDSSRSIRLNSGTMLITSAERSDAGVYRCTASIGNEAVHASARVIIRELPYFTEEPESVSVIEGGVAYFRCAADGHPKPTVTWTVNDESVDRYLRQSSRFSLTENLTDLRISDVRQRDAGTYECQAANSLGTSTARAQLTINRQDPPTFRTQGRTHTAEIGVDVQLECLAEGRPDPLLSWYRNDVEITTNNDNDKYEVNSEGFLTITNVTFEDAGEYECQAVNSAGNSKLTHRVALVGSSQVIYPGDEFVEEALQTARHDVSSAADQTLRELADRSKPLTSSDLLALFKFPSENAQSIARPTEIFERTLELIVEKVHQAARVQFTDSDHYRSVRSILSPHQLDEIARLSGCAESHPPIDCTDMCFHMKYRSIDGSCNNLHNPILGTSLTKFSRWLPPIYENNFNLPVGWNTSKLYHGFLKPSARLVSTQIFKSEEITPDTRFTSFLMQWGQFLDHDMTLTPMSVSRARFSDGRHCNSTCENQAPCFPIMTPPGDVRLRHSRCIGMSRSSAACGSGMTSVFFNKVTHREQLNELTAFIDASMVYGSDASFSRSLRDFSQNRGLLRTGLLQTQSRKELLPFNTNAPMDCQVDPTKRHVPCFLAGDLRANEQLGLLSMHTLFVREHNRLANELAEINPHWDDEMIYHETRKIIGALIQHVTYKHWLPSIIGPVGMSVLGDYDGYNPSEDPTILNVFATAAFRFGHSLINPILYRYNETMQEHSSGHLPLHKAFFAPFRIVEEGGIDPVIRGLFGTPAKLPTSTDVMNEELTEKLFKLAHQVALDLAALNIQRGRDHALPGYNEWRKKCGMNAAQTFDELENEIPDVKIRMKLEQVYGHPSNIDLFSGAMVERLMPGARVGPTFMCIITEQLRRLRNGDRFYYENPGVFSSDQLAEIKQFTLSHLICKSSDNITQVPKDVFRMSQYPQQYESCDRGRIPELNLKVWSKCCHECERSGDFQSITSSIRHRRIRGRRSVNDQFSYPEDKPVNPKSESKTEKLVYNELMEDRVEGLEEIIENLSQQLSSLNKQVESWSRKSSCTYNDKIYNHTETWHIRSDEINLCSSCSCQDGKVLCETVKC